MVLMLSYLIGTSCLAMDMPENDPLPEIASKRLIQFQRPLWAPTAILLPKELPLGLQVTGQVLLPKDWSFDLLNVATENRKDLRHFAILRGVSKSWYHMISAYFTTLSTPAIETSLKIEEEINQICISLKENSSVKREDLGFGPYPVLSFAETDGNTWDGEAQNLFTKSLMLKSKLVKNELSVMEFLLQESLYRLVALNSFNTLFNEKEIADRGKLVVGYITNLRSQIHNREVREIEGVQVLYPFLHTDEALCSSRDLSSIDKLWARDIQKLRARKDVFGAPLEVKSDKVSASKSREEFKEKNWKFKKRKDALGVNTQRQPRRPFVPRRATGEVDRVALFNELKEGFGIETQKPPRRPFVPKRVTGKVDRAALFHELRERFEK